MHFLLCSIEGQQVKMSEDHRIASYTERLRMQAAGEPLKDGETRLCGNLEFYISSRAYNYVYHSYLVSKSGCMFRFKSCTNVGWQVSQAAGSSIQFWTLHKSGGVHEFRKPGFCYNG